MIIKHLSYADAQAMSSIHHSFNFPWERPWSAKEYEQMINLASVDGFGSFIEGELIGFVLFQIAADIADILFIGVKPDFHGQEIGKRLLMEAEAFLSATKSVKKVFLEVCVENKNVIGFYNKNGYINKQLRINYYNINSIKFDALVMKKIL